MTTYELHPSNVTVEADAYARGKNRELLLFNESADGPVGDFPPSTGIVEKRRVV